MFTKQISSLKSLDFNKSTSKTVLFTSYPGAKDCLANLSAFSYNLNIFSKHVTLMEFYGEDWIEIIISLTKCSLTFNKIKNL